jgi:hypothetical protein
MKKWLKRIALSLIILVTLGIILMISFSPYGNHDDLPYKAVRQTVEINAPVEQVFSYMGNSANATKWSVYVDHISPLNAAEQRDGTVGSKRRCFTNADETGRAWDETILIVEKNKRRRLNIFNMVNFPMTSDCVLTEQLYEKVNDTKCKLTLTLFLDTEKAGLWDKFKMYYAAYQSNDIFARNLANIKKYNEEIYLATGK